MVENTLKGHQEIAVLKNDDDVAANFQSPS